MTSAAQNSKQVLAQKGTAPTPSFSFLGNNNTGFYLSGTNQISASINGTQYFTLSGAGLITNATWNGTAIGVSYGGTGQISYTDGQLLIGNSTGNTLAKATLTAGSGVTITNGPGSITIAASGGGGGTQGFVTQFNGRSGPPTKQSQGFGII